MCTPSMPTLLPTLAILPTLPTPSTQPILITVSRSQSLSEDNIYFSLPFNIETPALSNAQTRGYGGIDFE